MKPKFTYILRISEKAKHIRLQVTREKGLEIIVPTWFRASRAPVLVEKNRHWIERAFQKSNAFQGEIAPTPISQIPEEICLAAIDSKWRLVCCRIDTKSVVVRDTSDTTLSLLGSTDDFPACQKALKDWLTEKGKVHLIPWLKNVSESTGLRYSAVTIRQQKTRWGSCSPRGSISLNAALLLLPPGLVTYVLVHELCHTRELNHSRKFWRLVESYLPDYRRSERQLRDHSRCGQGWVS